MLPRKRLAALAALVLIPALVFAAPIARRYHRARAHARYWSQVNDGGHAPTSAPAPVFHPELPPSRPWLDPEHFAPPPTTYHTYRASSLLGQQTDYLLYLPPGYDDPANASRRYPVVYWFHGYLAAPRWAMPFFETLDAAVRNGDAPPMIAVIPNGLVDSWYTDSADGSQPLESILVNDLIPHIDATYRTIPDRRARAVEGFSMGAWGAAHLAFKHPGMFCAVTMLSCPVHTHATFPQFQRIFNSSEAAFYAEDPVTRAKRDADILGKALRVRILVGEADDSVYFSHHFDKRLEDWHIPHELKIVPGIGHDDDGLYRKLGTAEFRFYRGLFQGVAEREP